MILSFDLASPYAYLAVARADEVLGPGHELEPVLLGAIMRDRGWGSWALTDARAANVAEIEARSRARGLPLRWPVHWPANSLTAMRAATVARRHGALPAFARAAYRLGFGEGGDIEDLDLLARAGAEAGLDPERIRAGVADPEVKLELRETTGRAWAAGVRGVPTVRVDGLVLFGDDRLEGAAAAARAG